MLNCKQVTEQTSEYIDGNVTGLGKVRIKFHLLMCKHCRGFVKKIRITKSVVGKLSFAPVDKSKIDDIMDRIERDQKE
ncbi:zf-HC2 domain-containing protein [Marinicellulosiphila megalodicopiae]|uniref:zf-HC2 domain-containing protein n=1 Tax=Marinicellulosiphila megalodicopiae TaxID=2724896 RepID=UPI003BAED20C